MLSETTTQNNSPSRMPGATFGVAVGDAFIAALSGQDFAALEACFHPQARARLLTPSGLWTPTSPKGIAANFRKWFGAATWMEVQQVNIRLVGARLGIFYRILLKENGAWFVVEQQSYSTAPADSEAGAGPLESFDLICSGFQPAAAPEEGEPA